MSELLKNDRRKNNILDRLKHLTIEAEVVNKNIQLIMSDLNHLINDITEIKNGHNRTDSKS